jgi:hypothetical protein
MARNIKITEIGDYVNGRLEKLLRVAVLDADTRLKMESPVDTGRFRASWQVGENAAGSYDAGPQQAPVNIGKNLTSPPSKPEGFPLRKMNYRKETIGNVYSIHNNLPYAEKLALGQVGSGGSKQTSPGWVQMVAKDIQSFVIEEAAKIGRES